MSAFVVDNKHIDYLITAALRFSGGHMTYLHSRNPVDWTYLGHENASEIGVMLLAENVRSLNHRYGVSEPVPDYTYLCRPDHFYPEFGAANVLKAIECLDYQSCESPDWEQTTAYRFLEALKQTAIEQIPGYEEADWEIR